MTSRLKPLPHPSLLSLLSQSLQLPFELRSKPSLKWGWVELITAAVALQLAEQQVRLWANLKYFRLKAPYSFESPWRVWLKKTCGSDSQLSGAGLNHWSY